MVIVFSGVETLHATSLQTRTTVVVTFNDPNLPLSAPETRISGSLQFVFSAHKMVKCAEMLLAFG